MIGFIQQYERGHGGYTPERDRLLGNPTVDELAKKIEQRRKTMSAGVTQRRETRN